MRRALALLVGASIAAGALASPGAARADELREPGPIAKPARRESAVHWDPRWPKFRTSEGIATAALVGVAFGSLLIKPSPTRWTDINSFDGGVRDTLRIESLSGRNYARDVSDVLLALTVNKLVVDALVVTWWSHDRPEVAEQMFLMNIEAYAITGAINAIVAGAASRRRPYEGKCTGPEEKQPQDCTSSKRYRSFFSGHTSGSFTAAALSCAHHANLPLYGGGAADALGCAGGMLAAATVGTMRVMADQHFATDVITGAAVGTLAGLGVPYLLHYLHDERGEPRHQDRAKRAGLPRRRKPVRAMIVPAGVGGAVVGSFE